VGGGRTATGKTSGLYKHNQRGLARTIGGGTERAENKKRTEKKDDKKKQGDRDRWARVKKGKKAEGKGKTKEKGGMGGVRKGRTKDRTTEAKKEHETG